MSNNRFGRSLHDLAETLQTTIDTYENGVIDDHNASGLPLGEDPEYADILAALFVIGEAVQHLGHTANDLRYRATPGKYAARVVQSLGVEN